MGKDAQPSTRRTSLAMPRQSFDVVVKKTIGTVSIGGGTITPEEAAMRVIGKAIADDQLGPYPLNADFEYSIPNQYDGSEALHFQIHVEGSISKTE